MADVLEGVVGTLTTSNADLELAPNGTGHVTVKGAKIMGQKILQSNWLNID